MQLGRRQIKRPPAMHGGKGSKLIGVKHKHS
jgi:hypothetical protein